MRAPPQTFDMTDSVSMTTQAYTENEMPTLEPTAPMPTVLEMLRARSDASSMPTRRALNPFQASR